MNTIWNLNSNIQVDNTEKNINSIIIEILKQKGIKEKEEIDEFLSTKPTKTYDPFLLKDMKESVKKIKYAMENNKKILVYGDYDVDGITSTALLIGFLSEIYDNINYYIPNRKKDGYGLNNEVVHSLVEEGMDLLITVDCGITALEEVDTLRSLGVDVIITDHHSQGDDLPNSLVINPKRRDCSYPFKELCGCAVAFKLTQALQRDLELDKRLLNKNLDLVALATVSDMVPLIDENRTLLKYGLNILRKTNRIGLNTLIESINIKKEDINTGNIGFIIGPHFNAGGRVDDGKLGVDLLLTKNKIKAKEISEFLIDCNERRQSLQEEGIEKCVSIIEKNYLDDDFLIIKEDGLHEGVVGIIAGRIKEKYYKPVIVLTLGEGGIYKGSGRSIDGFNIYEELSSFKDLFEKFGGHTNACGLSIKEENICLLRDELNKRAKNLRDLDPNLFIRKLDISAKLSENDLKKDLVEHLSLLEPFGMGNEKPYFLIEDFLIKDGGKVKMGKKKNHLKLQGKEVYSGINAIGFNMVEDYFEKLNSPDRLDLVFYPDINIWRGKESIQLILKDFN